MSEVRTIALRAEPVTAENFARFGVLPPEEGDGAPTADLEFTLDDGWVNYIAHSLDEIPVRDGAYVCELLNRHDTHTQTLMPISADSVVVVAPRELDLTQPEHLDEIRALFVPQHVCVHLFRGTWHWGPYPVGADELRIFNVQGRGYPNDNTVADLAHTHRTVVTVQVSAAH